MCILFPPLCLRCKSLFVANEVSLIGSFLYLFLDSSTVGGSRDSGHNNSISEDNTGSSRCKRGG